jgi:sulfur-oxidizing protein SoxY
MPVAIMSRELRGASRTPSQARHRTSGTPSQVVLGASAVTRRKMLGTLAVLGGVGLVGSMPSAVSLARAQGHLANLGPEEPVETTMKRLFGARPIGDGASAIAIDLPLIAENGAVVPIAVEFNGPATPQRYVKAIYIVSDKNRRPLNAKFTLTPAVGLAYVGTNLRLGESTDVRAVIEMNDGTLLQAKRAVKVTVGGCGG